HGPHRVLEALVEQHGRMHAGVLEQVVHRDHLRDDGDVLPRVERDDDLGHLDAENVDLLGDEPGAVVVHAVVPILQLDDNLDALLLPDGADAEQGRDVDDPDSADLHVMPLELVAAPDEDVVAAPRDVDDIVRDEAVAALDQVQHALALADAAPADEQQAHAVHVRERAVHGRGRREVLLEVQLGPPVQLARLERRAEERDLALPRGLDHHGRDVESLGHDHGRDVETEEGVDRPAELVLRQRRDEHDLGPAEDLDSAVGQPVGVAGENEAGAGQVGLLDDAVQPDVAGQQLEREALLVLLEEIADGQLLHLATTPFENESTDLGLLTAERSRLRSRCRRSCAASLDRTRSSAERASSAAACAMTVELPVTKARTSTA